MPRAWTPPASRYPGVAWRGGPTGSFRFEIRSHPDPITGKRKKITGTGFATDKDANTAKLQAEKERDHATRSGLTDLTDMTLRQWLEVWLEERKPLVKPKTFDAYWQSVHVRIAPVRLKGGMPLGDVKLKDLRIEHVQLLVTHLSTIGGVPSCGVDLERDEQALDMRRNGATFVDIARALGISRTGAMKIVKRAESGYHGREPTPYDPNTLLLTIADLRHALAVAVARGHVIGNVAAKEALSLPRREEHDARTWDAVDVEKGFVLVRKLRDQQPVDSGRRYRPHLWILWPLALYTGFRSGEMCGLKWKDIFSDKGLLVLSNNRTHSSSAGTTDGTTKTGRSRTVELDERITSDLLAWRRHCERTVLKIEDRSWRGDDEYVLLSRRGNPMLPHKVLVAHKAMCSIADVPVIKVHELRHTVGTLLGESGADLRVIQEVLGHKVPTTAARYTKVGADRVATSRQNMLASVGLR